MSKKTITLFALLFLALGALVGGAWNLVSDRYHNTEACSTSFIVFYNDVRANVTMNFMYSLKKQKGIIAVSGTYVENGKLEGRIRRDVVYDWNENQDAYHLHSVKINKYAIIETLPDRLLANILPDFYVYPDNSVSYSILNQGDHGFLFTIGKRPLFYCAR